MCEGEKEVDWNEFDKYTDSVKKQDASWLGYIQLCVTLFLLLSSFLLVLPSSLKSVSCSLLAPVKRTIIDGP